MARKSDVHFDIVEKTDIIVAGDSRIDRLNALHIAKQLVTFTFDMLMSLSKAIRVMAKGKAVNN